MCDINKRIKIVREKKYGNRSKSKLCKQLDVPETTYQGYEKDTEIPGNFLKIFCEITNIDSNWLLSGKGSMEKTPGTGREYDTESLEKGAGSREAPQPYTIINTDWEALLKSLDGEQWSLAGKPERRILNKHRKPERRKTQHA